MKLEEFVKQFKSEVDGMKVFWDKSVAAGSDGFKGSQLPPPKGGGLEK